MGNGENTKDDTQTQTKDDDAAWAEAERQIRQNGATTVSIKSVKPVKRKADEDGDTNADTEQNSKENDRKKKKKDKHGGKDRDSGKKRDKEKRKSKH